MEVRHLLKIVNNKSKRRNMTEVWVMIKSTTDPFLTVQPQPLVWLLVTKYCLLPMGRYERKLSKMY